MTHPVSWQRKRLLVTNSSCVLLQSIADVVKDTSFFTRMGINLLAGQTKSEGLVTITAREFMFGYKNPLVTLGNKFMPTWIKFDKLGLIDRVSHIPWSDTSSVHSGDSDVPLTGMLPCPDVRLRRRLRDGVHGRDGRAEVRPHRHVQRVTATTPLEGRALQ